MFSRDIELKHWLEMVNNANGKLISLPGMKPIRVFLSKNLIVNLPYSSNEIVT